MSITLEKLKKLPDAPGVYLFKKGAKVLYVGKATSLKDRVRSYLSNAAVVSRGPKITKLIEEATVVAYKETDSVLEALIREAALIKQYQPPYNAKEKSDKSFNYVVITKEEFPRVFTVRERELLQTTNHSLQTSYGPFPNSTQLRDALKLVRKIFPYRGKTDAPLRSNKATKRQGNNSRLYEEIGLVPKGGGTDDPKAYNRTIKHLRMFFEGKKTALVKSIESDMKKLAKEKRFEEAHTLKRQLFALNHINDIALIKETKRQGNEATIRIEAYDVAHTAGRDVVGVMTVVEDGELARGEYRMFGIRGDKATKRQGNNGERFINDPAALREMLERRFGHPEWQYPRIIVVDGNVIQKNAAEKTLAELGIEIPVIAVTKNERHRAERLLGDADLIERYGHEIVAANHEAHRFSLAQHRKQRSKRM